MDTDQLRRGGMCFGYHLLELRTRLVLSLVIPPPLAIILFFFADTIRSILIKPALVALEANGLPAHLQALGPAEVLTTNLKLSIVGALILSAPWLLWQTWKFIEPGLYNHERRFVHFLIPGSAILTCAGLSLLYWVMLPLMLRVLISFGVPEPDPISAADMGQSTSEVASDSNSFATVPITNTPPDDLRPGTIWIDANSRSLMIVMPVAGSDDQYEIGSVAVNREGTISQEFRLAEYISFVLILMLAIAVAFQMPLVIVLLGWMGMADRRFLEKNRRYALFACAIMGAILTPADIVSMVLLFIPLYVLYELGILLLRIAPAERVAQGSILKGMINEIAGRIQSRTSDDSDSSNTSPDEKRDDEKPDDEKRDDENNDGAGS